MLISHECPTTLFPIHDLISDYPYVLGHLLTGSGNKEYVEFYTEKLRTSKFSILDNSCFELGKSIDLDELHELALKYKPKVLVLPDTLHNKEETLKMSTDFMKKYGNAGNLSEDVSVKVMGVLQGNTFQELIECFDYYHANGVKFIAVPFDCIKESDWHTMRAIFFKNHLLPRLKNMGKDAPKVHFLGLTNPSELLLYTPEEKQFIYSIDTSSPIIYGWNKIEYGEYGVFQPKPKEKLADNLDKYLFPDDIKCIVHNVTKFREYANGPK